MNRPKLSATTTPKLAALRFQRSAADSAAPTNPIRPSGPIGIRSPRAAEGLGGHGGQRGGRHARHRHDRAQVLLRSSQLRPGFPTGASVRTRSSIRSTAGAIGLRNRFGSTPINTARTMIGTSSAHSRGLRSGSAAFFSLRHRPVVDALEHPEHVGGRQDHAGRGDRGKARDSTRTRRAESGTRRRTRSGPAGRSTTT